MTLRLAVMLCTLIMVAPALSLASSRPLLTSRGDSHAQASNDAPRPALGRSRPLVPHHVFTSCKDAQAKFLDTPTDQTFSSMVDLCHTMLNKLRPPPGMRESP